LIMADQVARAMLAEVDRIAPSPRRVAVLDDPDGDLIIGAAKRRPGAELVVWCDSLTDQRAAVAAAAAAGLEIAMTDDLAAAVAGAELVLLRLPKSLAALELIAATVAGRADPGVVLLGGGRTKHLNRSMNDVLGRCFGAVRGSLGVGKARALVATSPRAEATTEPRRGRAGDLEVIAYGGVFAGATADRGTDLLLAQAERWPAAGTAIDLGCGTGLLAVTLARRQPGAVITAIDSSIAAVRSAEATVAANGVADRVAVRRGDGLRDVPDRSADLILCNPPFHQGTAKDSSPALTMIDDAGRVLRPGGELWLVYNTHLPYRSALRSRVGRTEVITQDRSYLVTRSVRGATS